MKSVLLNGLMVLFLFPGLLMAQVNQKQVEDRAKNVAELVKSLSKVLKIEGMQNVEFKDDGTLRFFGAQANPAGRMGVKFDQLADEETMLELELSHQQKKKYKDVLRDWKAQKKRLSQQFNKIYTNKKKAAEAKAVFEKLVKLPNEKTDEILKVLNKPQKRRLDQLLLRFFCRSRSIEYIFGTEQVKRYIGHDQNRYQKHITTVHKKLPEIQTKMEMAYRKAIETAFGSLTKDEMEKLKEKWSHLAPKKYMQIDRLRLQLQFYQEHKQLAGISDWFHKVDAFPYFKISVSGKITVGEIQNKLHPKYRIQRKMELVFLQFENNGLAALELDPKQKEKIQTAMEGYRSFMKKPLKYSLPFTKENREALRAEYDAYVQAKVDASASIEKVFKEILVPQQRKNLKLVALNALAQKYGPVYDLINGPLGMDLDIDPKKKERLKKDVKKAGDQLRKDVIEMENFWLKTVIDSLEKEPKKKAKKMFGSKPLNSPALLTRVIQTISSRSYRIR